MFFETADPSEVESRLSGEVYITRMEFGLPKLPVLSGEEVCGVLVAHGFVEVRRRGSHIIMQKRMENTTLTVPVPDHKELRSGTLAAIIRQSSLPRSVFEGD